MARVKKKSAKIGKTPSPVVATPKVVKKRGRPPKKPKATPAADEANGGATRSDNGFYNDEEMWIEIYYSLLEDARTKINNFRPPPMVEIVLIFNAFFQGYKEARIVDPPQTDVEKKSKVTSKGHVRNAHAVPVRPRKAFVEFRTYVWQNLMHIVSQFDDIPPLEHENNNNDMYRPIITPELLQSVVSGNRRIADLVWQDAQRDARPWLEKATARLSAREALFDYVHPLQRHCDSLMNTQEDPWTDGIWNPDGIIKMNGSESYQMVERHEHAAIANGLLFAAAIPPLGFSGDLRTLQNGDFNEAAVRAARNQMLTDEERRQRTAAEEDEWVERERNNHEANVALMVARDRVAEGIYTRIEASYDQMVEKEQESDVSNGDGEGSGDAKDDGNDGDSEVTEKYDEDDEDYDGDAMDIDG